MSGIAFLSACAGSPPVGEPLNDIAHDYVRLALEIDAHEPGYVDAYFGPDSWREEARRLPRDQKTLKVEADRLKSELARFHSDDPETAQRAKVLLADVSSARFRLDMIGGARAPFVEEAEKLFALKPQLKPLKYYDEALKRIAALAPGDGPLADRVEEFRRRYSIPEDRVTAVMDAAIAECRKRTLAHIPLPEGENFKMELVKNKPWGAYNYYKGQNQSLIQINTDLPVQIGNALILGCHEGYPGHHVQGIFNEKAYRERGWPEFSIAPLYSPAAPLNEGGADFGVELAFPGADRLKFEQDVLYPLAGLDPKTAPAYDAMRSAQDDLEGAQLTIAQMFLDGQINRSEAISLNEKYRLVARDVAEQALTFVDSYRSYVINYQSGEDVVRAYVDRAGADPDARWAAYLRIISQPTLASDLVPPASQPRHSGAQVK
ncbi:MAG TPA: hypothetical protein VG942_02580 [Hyphomonadaceae bacterium]|nr:hypothetical protein [Hyphomonadaceae bacterium]